MKANDKKDNGKRGIRCTIADRELTECYHTRPSSLKSSLIVRYCLGEYESCEIYKASMANGGAGKAKDE